MSLISLNLNLRGSLVTFTADDIPTTTDTAKTNLKRPNFCHGSVFTRFFPRALSQNANERASLREASEL